MSKYNDFTKTKLTLLCFLTVGSIFFQSCNKSKAAEETTIEKKVYVNEKNKVETMLLKNESFQKELVSNGKIIAAQKNSVQFEVSDKLEHLYEKNGDFVRKGQLLAS